eukprot:TRINITY_DN1747_c0_g1_i8.p1 TRINITY_DN1747_c0_g1~~TRINITY_DN1747_c0_g1_i8.p1  ORF type:complete len:264 (+),score=83.46 TRINITY_DN1747_c0_g1_i8:68-793(+)
MTGPEAFWAKKQMSNFRRWTISSNRLCTLLSCTLCSPLIFRLDPDDPVVDAVDVVDGPEGTDSPLGPGAGVISEKTTGDEACERRKGTLSLRGREEEEDDTESTDSETDDELFLRDLLEVFDGDPDASSLPFPPADTPGGGIAEDDAAEDDEDDEEDEEDEDETETPPEDESDEDVLDGDEAEGPAAADDGEGDGDEEGDVEKEVEKEAKGEEVPEMVPDFFLPLNIENTPLFFFSGQGRG